MSITHVAGGLQVAGLNRVEELAQMARRIRNRLRGPRKIVHFLPARPHLVRFIIANQRGFGPFEQAADMSHVLESRQRRWPEAENVEQVRKFQDGFQGVGSLSGVRQKKSSTSSRNVRW